MNRGQNQISGNSNATPEKLTIPSSFVLKLTQIAVAATAAADVLPSITASNMIQADAHLHLCGDQPNSLPLSCKETVSSCPFCVWANSYFIKQRRGCQDVTSSPAFCSTQRSSGWRVVSPHTNQNNSTIFSHRFQKEGMRQTLQRRGVTFNQIIWRCMIEAQ